MFGCHGFLTKFTKITKITRSVVVFVVFVGFVPRPVGRSPLLPNPGFRN